MMRIKNCFSVVAAFRLLRMSFSIVSVCSMWKSGWIKRKGNRKEKKQSSNHSSCFKRFYWEEDQRHNGV